MSLTAGARLGPYEITGAIGAGGMGEVYRARDTRLDRSVAIKVLPPGLTGNAERRARFEREARTLASLSHPRICTLFDVGEHNGSTFLVMEHLQGETLADRIFRGALPLAQALEIAVQIAEGLDAAHKRGIVHRDLKPGNVMLTKTGATLLDFGLAKLRGHGESPALTLVGNAPTESASITKEGTILGTLQYMAPEQIQGKEADAHADLWALGAMLYEMVSGKRPFTGDNPASLMGAILERDPPSLSTALPVSPPSLDRLLRRCLAKSPDERWESARDLADQLRWIAQDVERGQPDTAMAAKRPLWRRGATGAAIAVAGLLVGVAVLWLLRPAAGRAPRAVVRSVIEVRPTGAPETIEIANSPFGSGTILAWTPDGRSLVFQGRKGDTQQLFVRPLDGGDVRALTGTAGEPGPLRQEEGRWGASAPAVSADGQWVAFWADGAIRKVPLAGGPATVIAEKVPQPPADMEWGVSGLLVFNSGADGRIWRVRAGGIPEAVTTLGEGELGHFTPQLLPGEAAVLYTVRRRYWTWGDEQVVAQVLASGERKVLLDNATDARYLPPGRLLFMRQGTLFAVPFDPGPLEVKGEPVALLEGVDQALRGGGVDLTGAGQFALSSTGDLAYLASTSRPSLGAQLVTVDRAGLGEPLAAPARNYGPPEVSPDGRQLAVTIFSTTEVGLWIYDLSRRTLTKLTPPGGEVFWPRWSPDSRRVAFTSLRSGITTLVWQLADGSAPPETLAIDDATPSSWSPDGRELAVFKPNGIWVFDVTVKPPKLRPVVQAPEGAAWPAFSPDGHWLLYASCPGNCQPQVYVQPYPGPGPRLQVSVDGGYSPIWNPNGREILFIVDTEMSSRLMSVAVSLGATAILGPPRLVFEGENIRGCVPANCYPISPDGQHFFINRGVSSDQPPLPPVTQIHLVQNWLAELETRVPSGL